MRSSLELPSVKDSQSFREYMPRAYSNSIHFSAEGTRPMPRYFRLANKVESNNPITGLAKRYNPYRSISPLGFKDLKITEKINRSEYSDKDYLFHRQTKRNPKYCNVNPITGQISSHQISRSYIPIEYSKLNYSPALIRPARIWKGLGYKKSEIF